jgi:hypothetical protein
MTARRGALLLLAVFLAASAAAGVPLAQALRAPSERPRPVLLLAVACTEEPEAARLDPGYCARMARDTARRTRLTEPQRESGRALHVKVRQVLIGERRTECFAPSQVCRLVYLPAEPDQVRKALAYLEVTGAVVRFAGTGDPAPAGRLFIAAPAGSACVLGYFSPTAGQVTRIEGHLPGGSCLDA